MQAEDIFLGALERKSPTERLAYLDGACGGDAALRAQVDGLLAAHEQAGSFLNGPLFDGPATVDQPVVERPGVQIGPYKLLQQIGEGGFGVVFMAEQSEPVRRRVALKVIKPGMDTRQVIARFEAERQALAMMDHANIARVMDAGATASGRPYFVMELVRGVPITAYCDQHSLPIRERLALFASVCQAIQHAHQKGIIHRDIKPSNVLVTSQDGQAAVKVIDFGVAKAMGQQLTDKTLFTDFAQMIGTPLYMSPEQAELSGNDIDTRSDIYSLGVLLYELLTGSTPVDKEQMKKAAFDEIRRIIREDEPPKPSTRISSAEAAPSIAAQRHTEPGRLARLVKGELDWIVMKALEKDRNRRYETASAFAKDVEHFLNDEQVAACPPSSAYRLRKFARRNKAALATAAIVAAALLAGIAISTWQAIRATTAENLAKNRLVSEQKATAKAIAAGLETEKQRIKAQENFKDAQAQRRIAEENFARAKAAVERYFVQVSDSHLLKAAGLQPLRRELLAAALEFYAELTQQRASDPALMAELADAHYRAGRVLTELGSRDEARQAYAKAQGLYDELLKARPDDVELLHARSRCQFWQGAVPEAIAAWELLVKRVPERADIRRELASAYNTAAIKAYNAAQNVEALRRHEQALAIREQLVATDASNVEDRYALGQTLNNIAVLLTTRDADSLALYRRALEHGRFAYDRAPLNLNYGRLVGKAQANIAKHEGNLGSIPEAVASYRQAIDVWKKLALDNPAVPDLYANLVANYRLLAFFERDAGRPEWTHTMRLAQQVLERFPQQSATDLYNFACLHAVSSSLVVKDPLTASPQELLDAEREAKEAVAALNEAIQAGFGDLTLIQLDKDLDSLRRRDDFQQVVTQLDETLKSQQVAKAEQERGAKLESLVKSATLGASPESLEAGQALLAIRQSLANQNPERLDRQADVAATQHTVGLIQLGLGQLEEAARSLAQAEATRQDLVTAEPDKLTYQADLAATRLALGDLDWQANRLAQAAARWQQSLAQLESVVAAEATNNRFVSQLAAAHSAVGNRYAEIGLWNEAAGHFGKAFAAQPSGNSYNWVPVGYLAYYTGDRDAYRQVCAQALTRAAGNIDKRMLSDLTGCLCLSPQPQVASRQLVAMAQEVLAVEPTASWRRYRIALAQYRDGQYANALRSLEGYSGAWESWPLQAMLYHRLGQPTEARASLNKIDKLYDTHLRSALASESITLTNPGWLARIVVQLLRREAHELLDGRPLADGPLEHLLLARAYGRLEQSERSEAELQAAIKLAGDDSAALLSLVGVLDHLGKHESAETAFLKAAGMRPKDSGLWIARARQHLARGDHDRADALFAKAAEAKPDELHPFLEAGWWVSPEPPESGPLAADKARKWLHVPTAEWGRVDFQSVAEVKSLPTAYAVNYVYSPDARSVTLLVGSAAHVRLTVDDELIYEGEGRNWGWGLLRVPVLLRPGRNTFIVRITRPEHWQALYLRVADSPFDRGYLQAQLGLWDEALALWTPELKAHPRDDPWLLQHYAALLLAQNRTEEYQQWCRDLPKSLPAGLDGAFHVAGAISLAPVDEAEATRLLAMIEPPGGPKRQADWNLVFQAGVYYRAKRYEDALKLLDKPESRPEWLLGEVYLWRALCEHALGHSAAARAELERADAWGASLFGSLEPGIATSPILRRYNGVLELIRFFVVSREAHHVITSDAPPHDRILAEQAQQVRSYVQGSDQVSAAFDRAILVEPEAARHWLGRFRARNFAGQTELAERELEPLVRARPAQPDGWKIRGWLHASADRPEAAAADFAKALALMPTNEIWFASPRRQLAAHIAQWPSVFDKVAEQAPEERALWLGRAFWHSQHSRWREAADDMARVSEADLLYDEVRCYAGLRLLQGDKDEYQEICRRFIDRIAHLHDKNPWVGLALAHACTMSAEMPAEQSQVISWAEEARAVTGSQGLGQLVLGLAYYRAGEWQQAIAPLAESKRIWKYGHHPAEKLQADLVLAMCEHRLGQAAAAQKRLKAVCEVLDQTVPYRPDEPFVLHVPNWIGLNILRREAEQLLGRAP